MTPTAHASPIHLVVCNQFMQSQYSSFHVACVRNRKAMVPLLLEQNADVNVQNVVRGLSGHAWGGIGLRLQALV